MIFIIYLNFREKNIFILILFSVEGVLLTRLSLVSEQSHMILHYLKGQGFKKTVKAIKLFITVYLYI